MHYNLSIWENESYCVTDAYLVSHPANLFPVLTTTTFFSNETPAPDPIDSPLEETVREEREYVRRRLREELQREPTEDEVDDWLRRHTEGY
jgi:Mlc titration factor MtfA (ptsG expression regulator)